MNSYLNDGIYVVVSDLQVPYHDEVAVREVVQLIRKIRPAGLLTVGDEGDSPETARWNKAQAGEFSDTLVANLVKTQDVMLELDDALRFGRKGGKDLPHHVMRSNHMDRISKYVRQYAVALSGIPALRIDRLMGYQQPSSLNGRVLPITYHPEPWEFSPGWVLCHGDEGSGSIQTAGGTALNLAKRWGKSIVCGHTHKAGMQHHHMSLNGQIHQPLFGMEVGHLMDMTQANYLKAGSANWQQAVGILDIFNGKVKPSLHLIGVDR